MCPRLCFLIFLTAACVAGCGPGIPEGPYAEARFLPATVTPTAPGSNRQPDIELVAANQRLLDELLASAMIENTLHAIRAANTYKTAGIKALCRGEISEGVLCLRIYHPNKAFSLRFLWGLMDCFKKAKNAAEQKQSKKKLVAMSADLNRQLSIMHQIEDSLVFLKNRFGLYTTPEELQEQLRMNAVPAVDSLALGRYHMLHAKLQHVHLELIKRRREFEELKMQLAIAPYTLFVVKAPHYVSN